MEYTPLVDKIRLDDDFLKTYRGHQPKWGFDGLGWVIFLRTYARKKPDGTLEEWSETVQRFTEGNYRTEAERLQQIGELTEQRIDELNREMRAFYHLAFNLVLTPPGRGVWMSGTEYEKRSGDSLNNCWYVSMRPQPYVSGGPAKVSFAACFTFDQAMKGGGVGVGVQRKYVSLIPKVNNEVNVSFVVRDNHPDLAEITDILSAEGYLYNTRTAGYVYFHNDPSRAVPDARVIEIVDDSREGWVDTLKETIDGHYEGKTRITFDISDVRPRGSDIKGFGGTASGPGPLVKMLVRVNAILNRHVQSFVTTVEWGDVIQLIGTCVVAGNVRRTALILIGDQDDKAFVESKNYSLPENTIASQWRWASNNSIDVNSQTDRGTLRTMAENIYRNGEPGYVNIGLAQNYGRIIDGLQENIDMLVEGFNPCGEISLPNCSPCNLFEISLPRIHALVTAGLYDESLYEDAAILGVKYAYRVTFRHYDWAATRAIVSKEHRVGVGITGVTDWVLLKFGTKAILGYDENDDPVFNKDVTDVLDRMYDAAKNANIQHAASLHSTPSIKITTVKPSGTMSLLMGVSPGMHWHWSAYMIRRVRMSAHSALVVPLIDCGYNVEFAQNGFNDKGDPVYDMNTVVVEFPVKAPTVDHPDFQSVGEVPLREQAALQALLAYHWSDNAVSATLSFHKPKPKPVFDGFGIPLTDKFGNPVLQVYEREEEHVIEEITDVLDRYKGVIKSMSLLPYATDTYPQMPYEAITKQQYDQMVAKLTAKPWEIINGGIQADDDDLDESTECVGGHCPVR